MAAQTFAMAARFPFTLHHPLLLKPLLHLHATRISVPTLAQTDPASTLALQLFHTHASSSAIVEQEFAELNLKHISEQVGGIRTRQHVNPLKASLMVPIEPPKWEEIFPEPSLPIMVDIGCGSGRFLMMLAKINSRSCNFLGLDIRDKLVSRAKLWAGEHNLENLHFMVANATVAFESICSNYPGILSSVSILCPDPHFKRRHHKRRIVQMPLVDAIVKHLAPGGKVFLQSDVLDVAVAMKQQFDALNGISLMYENDLNPEKVDGDGWLIENPFGIPTEREVYALSQGGKIYRLLYSKLLDCEF